MRLRLTSTAAALTIGITSVVVIAVGAGGFVYSAHHVDELVARDRALARAQGELMRAALEHQMIENDRTLIGEMVRTFGREPRVRAVMLLDRAGRVRHASGIVVAAEDLRLDGATCQACHRFPAAERENSRVIETPGGTILRTVIPFRNQEKCHGCHDPQQRINGVMLFDMDASETRTAMTADLRWMVAGSSLLALFLIAALAIIVRVIVLRRLQRFETTARLIAGGDLKRRVPTTGNDTISWLAEEFNSLADSMCGLVDEVRRQRERLEVVMNSIDDGIVVLDPSRRVVAANDAFLRRAESSRIEVLGCSCGEHAPMGCATHECPTLACLESGERQVRICERHATDGRAVWEEVHASPVRSASGTLLQVVEVWRDISDRREAEARLAESHRLASLGLLASGFSHELNTPLGTVLTCVDGILRDARGEDGSSGIWQHVRENAVIAREQILRCRGITRHFLRFSRGEQSEADIVDLAFVLSTAARLVQPTAHERDVTIVVMPVTAGSRVRANEAELQQAVINLLLNATQATPRGGQVRLEATAGNPIRIRVVDKGCGIAPSDQTRIFEPFFSLRAGGTGLGLFMTKAMVRRAGGDITVASTPTVGSTFEIVLPVPDMSVEARPA
jgi:two-component system sensor histidine kinase AtoS